MRKILISTIATLGIIAWVYVASVAFNAPECEHLFVEIEQPTIKMQQPEFSLGGGVYQEYSWPTGLQEGKELICVKCFQKQKQVLDYGQAISGSSVSISAFATDSIAPFGHPILWSQRNMIVDSVYVTRIKKAHKKKK